MDQAAGPLWVLVINAVQTRAGACMAGREKELFISCQSCYLIHLLTATTDNKKKSSNLPTGRDKFAVYESPFMPLPIPSWHDALKAVKRDKMPAFYQMRHLFLEAAIFASTTEARHAISFATWNVF